MLECAQKYPKKENSPCESTKRVKSRSTDHRGENLKSKAKKRNTDLIFETEAEADVPKTQHKKMTLPFQN